jgi:hypothetical protein
VASDLLEGAETDKTFLTVITGDETWVYVYNPETEQQSSVEIPLLARNEKKYAKCAAKPK